MQLIARALRYLATRFLADPDPARADRGQSNQHTARTNAADASATLRRQRRDRDEVDAYLESWSPGHDAVNAPSGHDVRETRRAR